MGLGVALLILQLDGGLSTAQVALVKDQPLGGAVPGLLHSGTLLRCSKVAQMNSGCSAVAIAMWKPTRPSNSVPGTPSTSASIQK
ncbi:hypothetical protein D9M68_820810 [compost metagenome]